MELDFFVAGTNEVIDNVGGGSIPSSATEPLGAAETAHDGAGVVDSTVPASDRDQYGDLLSGWPTQRDNIRAGMRGQLLLLLFLDVLRLGGWFLAVNGSTGQTFKVVLFHTL